MSLRIINPPAAELITVAEAAEFMRIDDSDSESSTISAFIVAARQWCERYLDRAIGLQTLEVVLDQFPSGGIKLRPPIKEVTFVKYKDTAGVLQTVDSSDYYTAEDADPGLIEPVSTWPTILSVEDAVRARYETGYCAAGDSPVETEELPDTIKTAMLMMISDMYENRTAQVEKELKPNLTVERLLSVYRLDMGI